MHTSLKSLIFQGGSELSVFFSSPDLRIHSFQLLAHVVDATVWVNPILLQIKITLKFIFNVGK